MDDPLGLVPYETLRGRPLALALAPGQGVGLAWDGGSLAVPTTEPAAVVAQIAEHDPRWVWWLARETALPLLDAGVRPRTCWDLGAVARLLWAVRREEPDAVWAAAHGLPIPVRESRRPAPQGGPSLFELHDQETDDEAPVAEDGLLTQPWVNGRWATSPQAAQRWAELALQVQQIQVDQLTGLPDPRSEPRQPTLPTLTAMSESAAALLAVELGRDGLPLHLPTAEALLHDIVGDRPRDAAHERLLRQVRDDAVLQHAPGDPIDLRSPAQVRTLLGQVGLNLPDTRSWRLEPHAATSPLVAALTDLAQGGAGRHDVRLHLARPMCRGRGNRRPPARRVARLGRGRRTDDRVRRTAQPARRIAVRDPRRSRLHLRTRRPRADRTAGARHRFW